MPTASRMNGRESEETTVPDQPFREVKHRGDLLRFGIFELDTEAGQLCKNGRVVRLQPKPFKLLCLLAEKTGTLVTREEIQKALWSSGEFVDFEQGVNFAIKQVRDALGEDTERPLYIQTVPRRGYRFLAPVERASEKEEDPDDAIFRPATDELNKLLWMHVTDLKLVEAQRHARRVLAIKTAAAAFLLALIAAFLLLR
jgi:DNA-binding winged helix-turn-helix (wHTH) protein